MHYYVPVLHCCISGQDAERMGKLLASTNESRKGMVHAVSISGCNDGLVRLTTVDDADIAMGVRAGVR